VFGFLSLLLAPAAKPTGGRPVYPLAGLADEDLYRRFAGGEERAFGVLLDRHGDRVFGYLVRFFGDRETARDLVQEVFMRVITGAPSFRGDCSFRTFLFRVVRNLCIDVMRARAARPDAGAASLDAVEDPDDRPLSEVVAGREPDGVHRGLSRELSAALEEGLARLPPEQREVFLMREAEGLKFAEIAQVLGVNENTVKSRMHYAVQALRRDLAAFGDGS